MPRPTKEKSIYKVSIHKNGGYMYAATHPYGRDIPSQRSSELFAGITEDAKMKFFQLQGRVSGTGCIAGTGELKQGVPEVMVLLVS